MVNYDKFTSELSERLPTIESATSAQEVLVRISTQLLCSGCASRGIILSSGISFDARHLVCISTEEPSHFLKRILEESYNIARTLKNRHVGTEHVLVALVTLFPGCIVASDGHTVSFDEMLQIYSHAIRGVPHPTE